MASIRSNVHRVIAPLRRPRTWAHAAEARRGGFCRQHVHSHTVHPSFVERVKTAGANALLGVFHATGTRFDTNLEGMEVTKIGPGTVSAELLVTENISNVYGTFHGGAIATVVDIVGTMALLTLDPLRPGVSVEMSISYLAAAKLGERVRIEGRTLKTGKKLGFTQVDIFRAADGVALATGRHTKAL